MSLSDDLVAERRLQTLRTASRAPTTASWPPSWPDCKPSRSGLTTGPFGPDQQTEPVDLRPPGATSGPSETEADEQRALEQLAAVSVLARWVDDARVETAP